jgi:signal transduction histidine kinase
LRTARRRSVERALAWVATLAAVLAIGIVVEVLVLGRVPRGRERALLGPSLVAMTVAFAAAAPARRAVGSGLARVLHGDRTASEDVVRSFVDRAGQGVPDLELFLQLAESLQRQLRTRAVEVWVRRGDLVERVVSVPDQPITVVTLDDDVTRAFAGTAIAGPAFTAMWAPALLPEGTEHVRIAPAVFAASLLGAVVVARAPGAEDFTAEDDALLAELGRRVGVVLRNRQLDTALQSTLDELRLANDELRASRTRVVAAADAERRRIERDLHDGAQQHLVALAVNLRLARDLLDEDAPAARDVLDHLVDDVKDTVQQVRDLAHGIYPPLLVDAGLAEALRVVAARSAVPVEVDVTAARFDGDVEAAVYFCCVEALQNVARHASGSTAEVRAWTEDGTLRFTVRDDGPGFDPSTASSGHGMVNLRDRIGAIGGTITWSSTPGSGTTVDGAVPVGARA